MSHFAKVVDNIVTEVIVAEQDFIDTLTDSSAWVQTSYNTRGGKHYAPNTNDEDGGVALRKNYAGIGYTYDQQRDAFIEPKVFNSWVLNEETCIWEAPVARPEDGQDYIWNETTKQWDLNE